MLDGLNRAVVAAAVGGLAIALLPAAGLAAGVPASWGFDFQLHLTTGSNGRFAASGGIGTSGPSHLPLGSFVTEGGPNASNVYKVTSIAMPDAVLTVRQNGARHRLTLHFTRATRFSYNAPHAALTLALRVTGSNVPGCANGSSGTLSATTVSSPYAHGSPTLKLDLCGSLFHPPGLVGTTPTVDITGT